MPGQTILAYPRAPVLDGMPLFQRIGTVPQWYSERQQAAYNQYNSHTLMNIDGVQVPYNPRFEQCSQNHMQAVQAVRFQVNQPYTHLGGVVTARRYYVPV